MSANNALEDKNERKGDLSYHYWAGEKRDAPKAEPKVRFAFPIVRSSWSILPSFTGRSGSVASFM